MNVIYMVLDDVGFADLGCYGSEISTPYMDGLAQRGIRYTNFCATAMCSPSRAALLTGRNHHSVGMGAIANLDLGPDYPHTRGRITPAAATIAEILKEHNYSTFCTGKWHLAPSKELTPAGPFHNWPLGKGFERFYGFLEGSTDQYRPELIYDHHAVEPPDRANYHLSEDLVDRGIQFIKDQKSVYPEKPFFYYLTFGAQHAPHQAPRSYIERYKGVFDQGWDRIREARLARQIEMGIVPEGTELAPRNEGVKAWDELTNDERRLFIRFQETYAGFLTHTDEQIGRLLAFLDRIGELDNTMIVLLSDNGGSQEGGFNGSINQSSYFNFIEESVEGQLPYLEEIGGPHTGPNYPKGWSQASNTPFQQYKQNSHFGGIKVPFILHGPEKMIPQGAVRTQFHHVIDVTPTILDLLGIEPPASLHGVAQMPMHGVSMAYSFKEAQSKGRRETQYFMLKGDRAIWHKGWKAVTLHRPGESFEEQKWELYHVDEDFSEVRNVAGQYPDKLHQLQQLWWGEVGRFGALPLTEKTMGRISSKPTYENEATKLLPGNREEYVYYSGVCRISTSAMPNIINRSYTITALVDRADASCEGVLVAAGNRNSGYTLYIMNNKLMYEYNCAGIVYKIESGQEVPVGRSILKFVFEKTSSHAGIGRIFIDDSAVGEVTMPRTLPNRISHQGLDVGLDSLYPVSRGYADRGRFAFSGNIDKVIFRLRDDG